MTTNHIDQLAQWWETAKEGVINEGDRLIYRDGNDYDFRTATREDDGTGAEKEHEHGWGILARAPKPKPAWHDADFVVARYENDDHWQGYLHHGDLWIDSEGQKYTTGVLRDVTPLIEAKVTDEMIAGGVRGLIEPERTTDDVPEWRLEMYRDTVSRILHAALGIDPSA